MKHHNTNILKMLIGIATKLELNDLKKKGKFTETQILRFKSGIISFLSTLCAHIAEKSPLKMVFTRNARCLIPSMLVEVPDKSETRFSGILEALVSSQHITNSCAEDAKKEFFQFIKSVVKENRGEFLQLDKPNECDR